MQNYGLCGLPEAGSGRDTSAFLRRRNVSRSIITIRPQVSQRIFISAPVRITVHVSPPQGCGFRVRTTSPTRTVSTAGRAGTSYIAGHPDSEGNHRPIISQAA